MTIEFIDVTKLLTDQGIAMSRSEARRRVDSDGVRVNGQIFKWTDEIPQDATIEIKKQGQWVKIK